MVMGVPGAAEEHRPGDPSEERATEAAQGGGDAAHGLGPGEGQASQGPDEQAAQQPEQDEHDHAGSVIGRRRPHKRPIAGRHHRSRQGGGRPASVRQPGGQPESEEPS